MVVSLYICFPIFPQKLMFFVMKVLKEALTRSSESAQLNPDLADVRESVLQVCSLF
jgi:hypothetical protein